MARAARRWLVLAWVAPMVLTLATSAAPYNICNVSCCKTAPDCRRALSVDCDCPHHSKISLQRFEIPPTVKKINISNVAAVEIESLAIYDLPALANVTIYSVRKIHILKHGLILPKRAGLFFLSIENVELMQISSSAFAGVWNHNVNVNIKNATQVTVQKEAFNHKSRSQGPRVLLERVKSLDLAPEALKGPIFLLSFVNVSMTVCHCRTFGASIYQLELKQTTIIEAMSGCVSGFGKPTRVTLSHCRLENVHPQAFVGTIFELKIEHCDIGTVHTNGFQIQTTTIQITNSNVQKLRPKGLIIEANNSIILENVNLDFLETHAFVGMLITKRTDGGMQPMTFRNLRIRDAEDGSLALARCVRLRLFDLDIGSPREPVCPLEAWIRRLVDAVNPPVLTQPQKEIFFEFYNKKSTLCPHDVMNFPLTEATPACPDVGYAVPTDLAEVCVRGDSGPRGLDTRPTSAAASIADARDATQTPQTTASPVSRIDSRESSLPSPSPPAVGISHTQTMGVPGDAEATTDHLPRVSEGPHTHVDSTTNEGSFRSMGYDGSGSSQTVYLAPKEADEDPTSDPDPSTGRGFTRLLHSMFAFSEAASTVSTRELGTSGAPRQPAGANDLKPVSPEVKEVTNYHFQGMGGPHLVVMYCVLGVILILLIIMGLAVLLLIKRRTIPTLGPADAQLEARAAPSIRPPPPPDSPPDVIDLASRPRQARYSTADDWREHLSRLPLNDQYFEYHSYEEIRPELERLPPSDEAYMALLHSQRSSIRENHLYHRAYPDTQDPSPDRPQPQPNGRGSWIDRPEQLPDRRESQTGASDSPTKGSHRHE